MNFFKGDTKRIVIKRILPSFIYDEFSKKASIKRYLNSGKGEIHTADGFHYYKCIFVHIPKAAGLSICQSIFNNYGAGHYSLSDYQNIFSKRIFKAYFKFTIVRNPYSRFESAYYYLKNGGFDTRDRIWAEENLMPYADINEFVQHWLNSKTMFEMVHFKPQTYFLKDQSGEINLDFIGRLENIQEDYDFIKKKLGVTSILKKINTAKAKNDKIRLDIKSKEKIYQLYKHDFELLNYGK